MIFLTGFMGSGKTSVGKALARILDKPFIDMDALISTRSGSKISEIFKHAGEAAFRAIEKDVLLELVGSYTDCVVATGGGLPEDPLNRALMKASGIIVNLKCSLPALINRVGDDSSRPLWGADIDGLFSKRQLIYKDADLIIDTDELTIDDVAKSICTHVKDRYIQVPVALSTQPYPVYIGKDIFKDIAKIMHRHTRPEGIFILVDTTVYNHYMPLIRDALENIQHHIMIVPPGEGSKTHSFLGRVLDEMLGISINRDWACMAIGGGVVCDLAGFAASIVMRGIPVIQVPTTLLAQVDASIGGKTAINHELGKNLIGTFYQPIFVLCDIRFLETLEGDILASALAEVLKYGIIMDKDLFEYLEAEGAYDYKEIVRMCVRDKAYVVSMDEKEAGLRRILNFGHTLGHAIEKRAGFTILHGESVAMGILFASWFSSELGLLDKKSMRRIENLIKGLDLIKPDISFPTPASLESLLVMDKKAYKEGIQFVLTPCIGNAIVKKLSIPSILDAYERFIHGYKKGI
ncbi:MAG: 3-dehydroquinate synthase [Deltaproteobacteria bacterium]|nr:3-dehydroquinate synthase [Deltaproteobacteria bacterium]